jgi:hypothetical protein
MTKTEFHARIDRIAHKMLDCMGTILDSVERSPAPVSAGPITRADAAIWRWTNNQFALWKLCANRRCHRARCCRGEPRECLDRHLPQVPQSARDRVRLMLRAARTNARASAVSAKQ